MIKNRFPKYQFRDEPWMNIRLKKLKIIIIIKIVILDIEITLNIQSYSLQDVKIVNWRAGVIFLSLANSKWRFLAYISQLQF